MRLDLALLLALLLRLGCASTTAFFTLFLSLVGVGHWSKMLSMSARDTTPIAPLLSEDQNSIIEVKTRPRTKATPSPSRCLLA